MKTISLLALLLCIAPCLTAEGNKMSGVTMINLNTYASFFGFKGGEVVPSSRYVWSVPREHAERFVGLGGRDAVIDTPLEFGLLYAYSPVTIEDVSVRSSAEALLPRDNPRLVDLRMGAAVFKELVALRFVDPGSPAVGRHEGILRFICDRGNVSMDDVVATFRAGVREIVAEKVAREFNKISFMIDKTALISYNAILTREPNAEHYSLSYEGVTNGTVWTKELTATSLDALVAQMGRSSDFNQATIAVVRDRAGVMPGVVYGKWVDLGMVVNPLDLITEAITKFYLEPNDDNFMLVSRLYANYSVRSSQFPEANMASFSLHRSVEAIGGRQLSDKLTRNLTLYGQSNLAAIRLPGNYSMLFNYGVAP